MDDETNNLLLYESLREKYKEKYNEYHELSDLVAQKIKILNESKELKLSKIEKNKNDKLFDLERQKNKLDLEGSRINQEVIKLDYDTKCFNQNKVQFIDFNILKSEINEKNLEIELEIKKLQLYSVELYNIRDLILKDQDSEILKIKVEFKSNQLSGKDREVYIKEKITVKLQKQV